MKWMNGYDGMPRMVMEADDIDRASGLFREAESMWRRSYRDEGSCIVGAGIAVLGIPRGKRKPTDVLVIPSPGQGDGAASVNMPLHYLNRCGIPAYFMPGRMD